MNEKLSEPGKIITFYSYKGGVGRSMALANISCLLAKRLASSAKKILVIDWDLEAPGLHRYFSSQANQKKILNGPGLMDFFYKLKKLLDKKPDLINKIIESEDGMDILDNAIPLNNYIIPGPLKGIDFIKAGRFDDNYPDLVNSFGWEDFFDKCGAIFEVFKGLISSRYAYCLIDSRTGLTDISGICSMIMPEKLVTVFTPNVQSMEGVIDIIKQSIEYRRASDDFRPLAIFPLPSRIELAEKELRDEWRIKYQNEFGILFREVYELDRCDLSSYFDQIQLPHVSYYSYGEKIAVLEEYSSDMLSLSNAYERFMNYLIDLDFAWQEPDEARYISSTLKKTPFIRIKPLQEKEISFGKVFISSTFADLHDYRRAAIEIVNRYNLIPLAMEFFSKKSEEFTFVCEKEIRECDVFIGIYAHRYGFVPEGETKSITHLEYELAKELNKPCLCFIVDKEFPWLPSAIEIEKYAELKAFLEKVKKECSVEFFKSPDHFTMKLLASLGNLVAKQTGKSEQEERAHGIPVAPIPFIAHPYALPEHFTGRRVEMAMLSNWFFNEKQPVLVLEAIGGMGKSTLSWAWLYEEITNRAVKVDGIFWWSFYDDPFELFINRLYCYVTGKDVSQSIAMDELQAALTQRRFLLVLDGFERALRGYAGMEAMYIQEKRFAGNTQAESEWDKRMREPVYPQADRFLQTLCIGNTKTLMTSRLLPVSLEGIAGVKHVFLTGLSAEDTVTFFRSEGINGTRAEMEQAGRAYDFHPLMLKLLASAIKRSRAKDIKQAFSINLIDQKEPHKILERSVQLLSEEERRVAIRVAVFRGVFTFDAAKALAGKEVEVKRLWEVMQELISLGFVFYDESRDCFDFHPILRSYLYGQLTSSGGTAVHDLAAQYFEAIPRPEKVVSLEDLAPLIELYHHLVKAGKYDEAHELFRDWIHDLAYYQLAAYQLHIELLKELFPDREVVGQLPLLKKETDQAWILTALGNAYAISGQPVNAVPLFLLASKLKEKEDSMKDIDIGLGNAAYNQLPIGQLSAAAGHLRKSIALDREIKDEYQEAAGRAVLGYVLAYPGNANAEEELDIAFKLFEKDNIFQSMSLVSAHHSLSVLLQARLAAVLPGKENQSAELSRSALQYARQALTFVEKTIKTKYPYPRDFVGVYWLLGEALIQYETSAKENVPLKFDIPFFDEYFQQIEETVAVSVSNELNAAGRCLHEALRRCRKTNMVEIEPDILLALARLDFAQSKPPDETLLKEIMEIALRSGYRLKLADLHLFCGQTLLQINDRKTLLGLTAVEHLQKTKEYALDVSDISHLYEPVNSTADEFYKDIPEYEMLKRGMTHEERKKNGYWIAYQIAEILEKQPTNDTN